MSWGFLFAAIGDFSIGLLNLRPFSDFGTQPTSDLDELLFYVFFVFVRV